MRNFLTLIALALITFFTSGCASIVSGTTQTIAVNSIPSGATVTAQPVGLKVTTPGNLVLKRKDGPYRLTFSMDGYEPYSVMLSTNTNGWLWGDLLFGGIFGLIIDSSTGASIKLTPEEINANLVKANIEPQSSSGDIIYLFDKKGMLLNVVELQ